MTAPEADETPVPMMSPESAVIAEGVAGGLGRAKVGLTDRRLLLIFLFVVVIGAVFFWRQDQLTRKIDSNQRHAQDASHAVCIATDEGNTRVNKVLAQLSMNIANSTALTPAQKEAAQQSYAQLLLPVVDCSKLADQAP